MEAGRLILHEHPAYVASWSERVCKEMLNPDDVEKVIMHLCQYGQAEIDGRPLKKRTAWMSNSRDILEQLDEKCHGKGGTCLAIRTQYGDCSGTTARRAATRTAGSGS